MAKPPAKPSAKAPVKAPATKKPIIPPSTAKPIERIAGEALRKPDGIKPADVQKLAAEVLRHIEPRKGGKP